MCSTRDFEAIASVFQEVGKRGEYNIAHGIANYFEKQYSNFDKEKFLKKCFSY